MDGMKLPLVSVARRVGWTDLVFWLEKFDEKKVSLKFILIRIGNWIIKLDS